MLIAGSPREKQFKAWFPVSRFPDSASIVKRLTEWRRTRFEGPSPLTRSIYHEWPACQEPRFVSPVFLSFKWKAASTVEGNEWPERWVVEVCERDERLVQEAVIRDWEGLDSVGLNQEGLSCERNTHLGFAPEEFREIVRAAADIAWEAELDQQDIWTQADWRGEW